MTLATVAQPSGNTFAVLLVTFIIVSFITVIGFFLHGRMWDSHERKLGTHTEQLAGLDYRLESLLEFLGVEVPEPVEDDSPAAMAATYAHDCEHTSLQHGADGCNVPGCMCAFMSWNEDDYDERDTDEFPAIPATEPSGIPVQVHGALIEARDLSGEFPHPTDSDERKAKNAADIEEALKRFTFTGGRK